MFLQHEKMANLKLAIGKGEMIQCDAKGICEVKNDEVAQSLIASGFSPMEEKKQAAKKPAPIVEEPKEEIKEIEQPKEEPKAEKPKQKWQRSR